ncbi:testis-expressed protein 101 [Saccopteryx leptura]|uniref:testis-expressed protein 101 n=1 Tax=Saccopteryx leptura TaxID=249018 RepID=UPI00339C35C1
MGARRARGPLLLCLLGAALTLAQDMYCHKSVAMTVEEDLSRTFTWGAETVETCDNGAFCQESVLLVKSGARTAILATKSCISEGTESVTFVQHSPPPGIMIASYSSYCENPLCNNKNSLPDLWDLQVTPDPNVSKTLYCPTCVALGTCLSAPSLPCPNGTTRCYQGRLRVAGGNVDSTVEVKGCTSVTGCRLMSGIFTVGPMWVKEICPYQSLAQIQKSENGATSLAFSIGRLELLLLLLL